ncbi:hypothetical protein [Streptomyces sp. B146]|uniref:hypothetical protein n=1 Tax=Streptomyces sp. B146 TaxID=2944251 RepID=UPI00244EDC5F|nr:hypothetical protein [Streptomyces sp. B146]WGK50951.1 hypothetical protein M6G09_38090 [Streptomyces sp. B146]
MLDPSLATFLEVVLGVRPAQAKVGRIVGEVVKLYQRLLEVLEEFAAAAVAADRRVRGAVQGEWEKRFSQVMRAFSGGEGREYVDALVAGAGEMVSYAFEYAVQVVKTNASLKWHALRLLAEFAAVMAMAWLNPLGALLQWLRLQALYRLLMQNILSRLLLWVGARAGAMVSVETVLGVAIEKFALMEAGAKGFRSRREKEYLRQAAVAGAAGGAVGWVLPSVGQAVVGGVRRWLRGAGGGPGGRSLARELDDVLGRQVGGPPVRTAVGSVPGSAGVGRGLVGGVGAVGGVVSGRRLVGEGVGEGVSGSFGQGFSVSVGRMANVLEKSSLEPSVRRRLVGEFVEETGERFERYLAAQVGGGKAARELGRAWAEKFTADYGRRSLSGDLYRLLGDTPRPLPVGVRELLSSRTVGFTAPGWWSKGALVVGVGAGAGAGASVLAEGTAGAALGQGFSVTAMGAANGAVGGCAGDRGGDGWSQRGRSSEGDPRPVQDPPPTPTHPHDHRHVHTEGRHRVRRRPEAQSAGHAGRGTHHAHHARRSGTR